MAAGRTLGLLAAVGLLLALAARPGVVGLIADGRQMIFTAVALAESGSLGQPRNRDLTVARPEGDAVSRYGLGMSLAQLPAAFAAPLWEARRGPGSSQVLFLIAPFTMVLACGVVAARVARRLGSNAAGQQAALLLAMVASPFGVYATTELSEPLQGLCLLGSYAAALKACAQPRPAHVRFAAVVCGVWMGIAVLTKSSLLFVAPLTLTPLMAAPRERRGSVVRWVLAGFAPFAMAWLVFEIARFGRPFAGYMGEGFTHPFLDGAWRLLVGSNKGLLLYFPAALIATTALARAVRTDPQRALVFCGAWLPMAALWLLAAPWWAWHGVDGWGPRLLVPGIPLLASLAAVELGRWPAPARLAVIAVCFALNVPPLLQHPTPVVRYTWLCLWPEVSAEAAAGVPPFARRELNGTMHIPPDQVLARTAAASPFRLLPWFFAASRGGGAALAAELNAPPWAAAHPEIRPEPPLGPEQAAALASPAFAVYDAALADQVLRAQQLRRPDAALALARKLEDLAPGGFADALLLECYRLLGRKADAIAWLQGLSLDRRQHPAINVVLALWDRDEGKEQEARALLQSSAGAYRGTPLNRAVNAPLAEWPPDLASMTENAALRVRVQ
jgi:hypothetical protein